MIAMVVGSERAEPLVNCREGRVLHAPLTKAAATYFASVSTIYALLRSGDFGQLFRPPYGHLKREKEHIPRRCYGRAHTYVHTYTHIL